MLQVFLAFGVALLLALRLYGSGESWYQYWGVLLLGVVSAAIGVFAIPELRSREASARPFHEPAFIAGVLQSLHQKLCDVVGEEAKARDFFRVALHKVRWTRDRSAPNELVQISSYVGGRGGSIGRVFSCRCGIIGVCARSGEFQFAKRNADDPADYRADLVNQWGFTWDEAGDRVVDRFSWVAAPIFAADDGNDRVVAVVYVDCAKRILGEPEHEAADKLREIVFGECQTLAKLIAREYGSSEVQ
ncbi:MAG: hypothetical protein AAGI30_06945 [Planctomycetota bacterium]